MTREEQIKKIFDFIHNEHVCVISTVTADGKPEAATMGFSETKDLKLIFQTPDNTRKYINLKNKPNIAAVIGWDLEKFITIQYEGVAEEVGESDREKIGKIHILKNPQSREYFSIKENKYFIATPTWIRYRDVNGNTKFEVNF